MFNNPLWASLIDLNGANGIVNAVSRPRLVPYGLNDLPAGDPIGAVARHCRNITLCEAAYPVLHLLEVVMRNRIHDAFRVHFSAPDWYDQGWLNPGHMNLVTEARADLTRQGKPLHPDRVVAALSFGFWCAMFHSGYESASGPWPKLLQVVLPRIPKSWRTRDKVKHRVEAARFLRNRVFHHESIMQLVDLYDRHRALVELLGWFSPEARQHLERICRFRATYGDHLVQAPILTPG